MATALQVKNQQIFDLNNGYRIVVSQFTQANDTSNTLTIPAGGVSAQVYVKSGDTAPTTAPSISGTTATIGAGGAGTYGADMWLVSLHAGNIAAAR